MGDDILAYITFAVSIVAMLTIGTVLQEMHLQGGLIASEIVCVLLPAAIVWHLHSDEPEWNFPSLRRLGMPPRWLAWVAITAACVGIAANVVTGVLVEAIPAFGEMAEQYEESIASLLRPDDTALAILGAVAVTVVAPLCEEALFRGAILTAQRTADQHIAVVILVNGVLFAALHLNPMAFVALVGVGAFFAHLTLLTRSLWPAIFAHAVLNAVNGLVAPLLLVDRGEAPVDPTMTEFLLGTAIAVPIAAGLWTFGARRLRSEGTDD